MQRRLELFKVFHSQEAGYLDARIDKTHELFRKIDDKIAICNIENLRSDDLAKIIIMMCLGSRELRKSITEEENRRVKTKQSEMALPELQEMVMDYVDTQV